MTSARKRGILTRMLAPYVFIGAMLYLFPKAGMSLLLLWAVLLYFGHRWP